MRGQGKDEVLDELAFTDSDGMEKLRNLRLNKEIITGQCRRSNAGEPNEDLKWQQ